MTDTLLLYGGFTAVVLALLAFDLGVFHRKAHAVSVKEALAWSGVWIGLALVFNAGVWVWKGPEKGLEFFAGYLIEKALSVDNIFVFIVIFSFFKVPAAYQHKVLFWGILGALVMRAIMIAAGAALIQRFHAVVYVFGAFLVLTGIKIALAKEGGIEPGRNPIVRFFKRLMPLTPDYRGDRFLVVEEGRRRGTPLLLVLVVVETTDLAFAVDSIPAVFAVTSDPFLVYTSNIFAILGLRALYFALAGVMGFFRYLKPALAAILTFVGVKMLLTDVFKIPIGISLGIIGAILVTSVTASMLWPLKKAEGPALPPPPE